MKKLIYVTIIGSFLGARIIYFDITYFRISLYRACLVCLLLAFLVIITTGKAIGLNSRNKHSVTFMFIWCLYAFISVLWVEDFLSWIKACSFIGCGMVASVVFSQYFISLMDFRKVFFLMSIINLFHQIIGWYEIQTRNYLLLEGDYNIAVYTSAVRTPQAIPIALSGNPNNYAMLMLFGIFVAYICIRLCKSKAMKIIYLGSIVSGCLLLYATNSRANYIGFLMGAAFILFMQLKKQRVFVKVVLSFICVLTVLITLPIIIETFQKLLSLIALDIDINSLNSGGVRVNLILNGVLFLFQTAGFGVGAGNIEHWMATRSAFPTREITNIHNWWAEIFAAYGVAIFAFYIIFYSGLFMNFYKRYRFSKSRDERVISLGLMGILVGFIVGSMSASSNISEEWLWVFFAIMIAFQGYKSEFTIEEVNDYLAKISE